MKDDPYGYNRTPIVTSILTEEEVEQRRNDIAILKKEKQMLQDILLELNIKTEIELDETLADFLRKENII